MKSNVVISSAMNNGARKLLLRLIEDGFISIDFPRLIAGVKPTHKQMNRLWFYSLINQCEQDLGFIEKYLLGYELIPHYSHIEIKGKQYLYLTFTFEDIE